MRIVVPLLALIIGVQARGAVPAAADQSLAAGLLDRYSHGVFEFNRMIYQGMGQLPGQMHIPDDGALAVAGTGFANVVSNLISEPMTAAASLMMGDLAMAGRAAQRFAINSTAGYLGVQDRASEWGYARRPADFGLMLCRWGIGEGGYVVLPFIGPRTLRDGLSDVVLTNLLLWPLVGVVAGSGTSLRTILIAETVEIAADIAATRQIDPLARELSMDDYATMQAAYLTERRLRCGS